MSRRARRSVVDPSADTHPPVRVIVDPREHAVCGVTGPGMTGRVKGMSAGTVRRFDELGERYGITRQGVHQAERKLFIKVARSIDRLAADDGLLELAIGVLGEAPGSRALDFADDWTERRDWRAIERDRARAEFRAELVGRLGEIEGNAEADRIERIRDEQLRKGAA